MEEDLQRIVTEIDKLQEALLAIIQELNNIIGGQG